MADQALKLSDVLREELVRLHGPIDPQTLAKIDSAPDEPARLRAIYAAIHALQEPRTAFCLSGGGIRSATFALGVMQRLARLGLLDRFHYLSTVSGGGYIGSWLSSFVRRDPGGITTVAQSIDPINTKQRDPLQPEVEPLTWLRRFSNYLTPKLGLMSGDTWAFFGSYLRNLVLNWLIFVPLLVALLALPRLAIAVLRLHETNPHWNLPNIGFALASVLIFIATAILAFTRPTSYKEEGWLTNGRFQRYVLLPYFLAAVLLVLFWAVRYADLQDFRKWTPVFIAFIGISVLSSIVYMARYFYAVSRERIATAATRKRKLVVELIAAGVAGAVAAALLYVCATQFFDDPLGKVSLPTLQSWMTLPPTLSSAPTEMFLCFGVPLVLAILFAQAAIFVAGVSWYNEEYDREWWGRAAGWVLIAAIAWMMITAITIWGPVLIYEAPRIFATIAGASGLVSILLGKSGQTAANDREQDENATTTSKGTNIALGLIAPVFAISILALLSLITSNILLDMKNPPGLLTDEQLALSSIGSHQIRFPRTYQNSGETLAGNFQTTRFPAVDPDRVKALQHLWVVDNTTLPEGLVLVVALGIFSWLVSFVIGANQFSMHGLYRNRLVRAYLGASRFSRHPNRFSGFDPNDNLPMHRLRPELFWATSFQSVGTLAPTIRNDADLKPYFTTATLTALDAAEKDPDDVQLCLEASDLLANDVNRALDAITLGKPTDRVPQSVQNRMVLEQRYSAHIVPMSTHRRPMHVVNMTLNLVGGDNLAWQERKAESFTVTPVHSGSFRLGYRPTRAYGSPTTGITLGTAVAISGAAASPNMGYNSSPALSFLLTLFNVRLGWWLGNPKKETYKDRNPSNTLRTILDEAFGVTNDEHDYIYLSDGGHFENLGLYEMVLRRCRCIVLCDAAADPSFGFDDLGNAIRKIRIDFGINITINAKGLFPRNAREKTQPKYCAVATIHYSDVDPGAEDGHLLYLKPAFYGANEPKDVYNYASTYQTFPHQSTGDQFFSESQFESYRTLGYFALGEAANGKKGFASVCALIKEAEEYLEQPPPVAPLQATTETAPLPGPG
jgi:hypothetical protein